MEQIKTFCILLIEDSIVEERVIRHIFEDAGYKVISAYNQIDGLRMVKEHLPDLVVLDYLLPDGDGLHICKAIKEIAKQEKQMLPVIMLTIKNDTKDIVDGFRSGADDYVIKPPIREDLLARVQRLLGTSQLHVNLRDTYGRLAETVNQMQSELDIVAKIQHSFLPETLPQHPLINVSTYYAPSMRAGGDYYDIVEVDQNHWGIVMADIAGHGASAAVIMGLTQMTVKEFSVGMLQPNEALQCFDQILKQHVKSNHFVTMFYGILNVKTLMLNYSSAGHPPPLYYCAQKNELIELKNEEGFPLISFDNHQMDVQQQSLQPNDKLLLYTDGIIDVRNSSQETYGINRLKQLIMENQSHDGQNMIDEIMRTLIDFRKNETYDDDISMMVIDHI